MLSQASKMVDVAEGQPAPLGPVECAHGERCGGCPLLKLGYEEQLARKRGRVVEAAQRFEPLALFTEPVAAAESITAYRTRAKVIVGPGGEVGLFARGGGHRVVDIPSCRVLTPRLLAAAETLRRAIQRDKEAGGPLSPYDPARGGALRALDFREVLGVGEGEQGVLVTLVMQRERTPSLEALQAAAEALHFENPSLLGVALNYHEGDAPQILGAETQVLFGVSEALDRVGNTSHLATYGSFVQAHRGQAERVHRWLAEALGLTGARPANAERPRVLDLYGGSGAIALSLATAGADVHLVESFGPAVLRAREAAARAGLPVWAEEGDVATVLRQFVDERVPVFAVVVNPPRRGMTPEARDAVANLGAELVAYVSCDPETLARDLDHLQRCGYRADRLRPLDMIPLTDEVETVAILRRGPRPLPEVVYEDETLLVVVKGAHEPTTPQGEYAHSLLSRARQHPNGSTATPVHRLDVGTSGLLLLAKAPERVAPWAAALGAEGARKMYLAAVRGVTPTKGAVARDLREGDKAYPARTRYRRLGVLGGHSLLRVQPEQGRTHQIRRHLAAIGHPVLGDDRYGHAPSNRFFAEKHGLDRTFLHCVRIALVHPHTGAELVFEAKLPGDLRGVVERVGGPSAMRFLDHKSALGRPSTFSSS